MANVAEHTTDFIQVTIAGIKFEIECIDRKSYSFFRRYLSSFKHPDQIISVSRNEIDDRRRVISYTNDGSLTSITTDSDLIIERCLIHEKIANIIPMYNALLMHGAVISKNECAYMFSASSGVGKTTRAKVWLDEYPDSIVINGDKPFIRIDGDNVLACGTPWCGKEGWNSNVIVPLRAIYLIERADDGESSIEEISLGKAFPFLLQQTFIPNEACMIRKTFILLKAMEGKVKFFKLRSAPTQEAIRLAYETARPR